MKITEDGLQIAIEAYETYTPINEIAKWLGVSRQGLYKALKKYGVKQRKSKFKVKCDGCGEEFERFYSQLKLKIKNYCSGQCYYKTVGNEDYMQNRNGCRIAKKVILGCEFHVMAPMVIHHEDGNNLNNEPYNLKVFKDHSEHMRWHRAGGPESGVVPFWEGLESGAVEIPKVDRKIKTERAAEAKYRTKTPAGDVKVNAAINNFFEPQPKAKWKGGKK